MGTLIRIVAPLWLALAIVAPARAASPADATLHVDPDRGVLRIDGVIGPRFERDVRRALRRHRGLQRIDIASPGGLRAPALRIGALAAARGLAVRVDGRCSSACVLLWSTAHQREATAGSRIGLHGSSLDPGLALPAALRRTLVARNDRETDAVLRRAGFPDDAIARGAATPHTRMAWFTAEELRAGGVAIRVLDVAPSRVDATAVAVVGLESATSADEPALSSR